MPESLETARFVASIPRPSQKQNRCSAALGGLDDARVGARVEPERTCRAGCWATSGLYDIPNERPWTRTAGSSSGATRTRPVAASADRPRGAGRSSAHRGRSRCPALAALGKTRPRGGPSASRRSCCATARRRTRGRRDLAHHRFVVEAADAGLRTLAPVVTPIMGRPGWTAALGGTGRGVAKRDLTHRELATRRGRRQRRAQAAQGAAALGL